MKYLPILGFGVRGESLKCDTAIVIALVAVALVGVTVYIFYWRINRTCYAVWDISHFMGDSGVCVV